MRLEDEIKQKTFKSEYQKAIININYTAIWLTSRQNKLLKPYKVSIQQFNILRILRGQHPKAVPLKMLTERMIDKMSNTSRLVEKLRAKGFVNREICSGNRRQVDISITESGLRFIEKISSIIDEEIEQFCFVSEEDVKHLNRILDTLRNVKDGEAPSIS